MMKIYGDAKRNIRYLVMEKNNDDVYIFEKKIKTNVVTLFIWIRFFRNKFWSLRCTVFVIFYRMSEPLRTSVSVTRNTIIFMKHDFLTGNNFCWHGTVFFLTWKKKIRVVFRGVKVIPLTTFVLIRSFHELPNYDKGRRAGRLCNCI